MREPLLHFSRKPLSAIHSVEQSRKISCKPNGLWVSAGQGDDSWPAWCRSESFGLDAFAHVAEVVLSRDARILWVSGHDGITDFDAEFGETPDYLKDLGPATKIAWDRVAARYQGIVIAPYVWSQRLGNCDWYYTWDCASGCVWDASAVAELRPIHGLDLRMDERADA